MSRGTDRRTVRVAPELWERAGRVAVSKDETLSDVMRRALEDYAKPCEHILQTGIDAETWKCLHCGEHFTYDSSTNGELMVNHEPSI